MKRTRLLQPTLLILAVMVCLCAYFPLRSIWAGSPATILPSVGKPLVNFTTTNTFSFTYTGPASAVKALKSGTPTALAAADFNADGALDMVAGYSTGSGGVIALMRGNPVAYAPTDATLKALRGSVPPTFLSKASVFAVPVSPDLMVTGDFNQDGNKDLLVAARGGSLYLLAGNGAGSFAAPQLVPLNGEVHALAVTGDSHVAVSLDGPKGPQVEILAPSASSLISGATYPLPARGVSMDWANLGGGTDLAVAAGTNAVIIYNALKSTAQIESLNLPFQVQALAIGDYIWDRDGRLEISLLAEDGSVHILQHGTLNTAALTPASASGRRAAAKAALKSKQPTNPMSVGPWTIAKQLPYTGSAPANPVSKSAFNSPRLAESSTHDVMVLDASRNQLNILDTSGKTANPSAAVSFASAPVAALAMPQKSDGSRDLVVLTSSQSAPQGITSNGSLTLTVNTTSDEDSVGACADNSTVTTPPSTLSLREAVCIANNNGATTTTIDVPAGTYSLSISTYGGNGSEGSDGELQIGMQSGNNISVVGAGSSSTIIQQTNGTSRIFEQDQVFIGNVVVSLSNLTLQNGNCTSGQDCTYGGGAMLGGGNTGDNLTLTNVVMSHNLAGISSDVAVGGGLAFASSGNLTVTGSTFSNNTAVGDGGGGLSFLENEDSGNLSITSASFTSNTSTGGGGGLFVSDGSGDSATITGSTFTGNTTAGNDPPGGGGGGIYSTGNNITVSNSRIVGNSGTPGSGFSLQSNTGTAINNWWGCNGGPGASGCDTVEADGATLNYSPWLVLTLSASPNSIETGQTSSLTGAIDTNSNNQTGFSAPNGTAISFSGGSLGSANPTSTTLTNGSATSTFTAGSAGGSASPSATVDNQTVNTSITIGAPPEITSANSTTFIVGTAGSFTVTTTGSPAPSLGESGALPSGVTFTDNGNGTATLAGTPSAGTGGTYPFTITASNGFSPNATQSFTLTVDQAPAITSGNSTTFTQGSAGTFTVTTNGFPTPSLSESGGLPNGVTFIDNHNGTATLSGTASQSGTYPFTITASNGVSPNATQNFTLTVNPEQVSLTESASPAGSGTITPGNGTYNLGSVVPITATSAAGYVFVNWTSSPDSVANPSSPSTSITMNNNETVTANFQAYATAVPTSTAVSSSQNPSYTTAPDNSVTFTATVTYDGSTPVTNGTVSFTANGSPIANGTGIALNGSGQAQVITSFSTEGTQNIVATYSGYNSVSMSFLGSMDSLTQTVSNHTVQTGNQFCNTGAITIPNAAGEASPYPSNIFVTGESGNLGTVTLTLNGINSSNIQATDLLLVGPTGAALVPFASVGDGSTIDNVNVTLADDGSGLMPSGSPLISGTYQPTSKTGSTTLTFPAPAPTINAGNFAATDGSATFASQFGNTAPNGTWQLYAQASSANAAGSIGGGWCVTVTTGAAPTITSGNSTTFTEGTFGSFTVTTTGTPTPAISESGSLPSGVTLHDNGNGTATLSGTPATGTSSSSPYVFAITANNGVLPNAQQTFTLTVVPATVQVMVGTSPTGLSFTVDSITYTSAQTFTWNVGSSHSIATTSPQAGTVGTQYVWSNWSDGGAISHSVTAPSTPTTYTATFNTQYQLTTAASPSADGTVSPSSGNFYNSGTVVNLMATANSGYTFSNWTGPVANSSSASTTVTMSAPESVTANFVTGTVQVTVGTNPGGLSFTVDSTTYTSTQTLTWNIGSSHTISTTSPQAGTTGTQYVWSNWSDGGAISHSVTAPSTPITYTASFATQYQLTTAANPVVGGTVSPASGGFYNSGTIVNLMATANSGYAFSNWTGPVANSSSASTTVTMSAPESVTANFAQSGPIVTLIPASVNFETVYLYTLKTQEITLKNAGTSSLSISKVSLTAGSGTNKDDFSFVSLCPKTLAAGKSCIIEVFFLAGNIGNLSATLSITDNAAASPQTVPFSATVINPFASFNPASVNFGTQKVGHSVSKNVTLTNSGTTALTITSIAITGADEADFSQTNACPDSLNPGSDCMISVTFDPTKSGTRTAGLTVTDNEFNSRQTVPLTGRGD